MKAFILATAAILLYTLLITLLFRFRRVEHRARAMMRLFLLSLPPFAALVVMSPADLGCLPASLVEPIWWVEPAFAGLLYTAAFLGGVLQLYNLADRGFSLRIVIDVDQSNEQPLSAETIYHAYSEGKGIPWMYEKRIAGMLENGLVEVSDGIIRNTAKGAKAARLFGWLRRFLKIDEGSSCESSTPTAETNPEAAGRRARRRSVESAPTL